VPSCAVLWSFALLPPAPLFVLPQDELAQVISASPIDAKGLSCPSGTKLVVGTHHENVERLCIDFHQGQCWDFFPGLVALEARSTPIAVCMDEFEWPNQKGALPPVMMRFSEATESCSKVGKRLCSEFEWELACEGPELRPFPYGFKQEPLGCINEKPYRVYSAKAIDSSDKEVRDRETTRLYQAEPSGSRPSCTSSYGVVDLVGNVEEWVTTSRPEWAYPSSLKGGYWSKPWSGCRGTNDSHGPLFRFYEVGFRCCAEPIPAKQ
jgi:Sulfatase-modifying factor enzyme 1